MLFGYQARADARSQVLVEEASHLGARDVLATLEETAREDGDRVGMRLDQLSEDFGEANLIFETANGSALPGKECGQ